MAELNVEQFDKEILPFLANTSRPDVRCVAMQYFLGLTGSEDGCHFIAQNEKYVTAIIDISQDRSQPGIMKDALLALVNLTTYPNIALTIASLELKQDFILEHLTQVINSNCVYADIVCSILSNVTRNDKCASLVVNTILAHQETVGFDKIITAFCTMGYNKNATLHYLGSVLSNLTQLPETRRYILDKNRCVVQRLLPFTEYQESVIRRGGVVATLHNCCFETEYHEWLLSEEIDILPRLMLPLAGPEEIDDDDMEKLPVDLQYLEPTKEREDDPDIRKLLLDTINQLCATEKCREHIKGKNAYVIMQKLHLWESDPAARVACEKLVDLLIVEDPIADNLREVEIPSDLQKKLDAGHEQLIKEIEEETKTLKDDNPEKVTTAVNT